MYAIDTGHGVFDWRLRNDDRVVVMERTNALHVELPEPVQLVTIDVAWTRQHLVIPRAMELLDSGGLIVTLIKPHYEAEKKQLSRGVLSAELLDDVVSDVIERLGNLGAKVVGKVDSPILGDKGNREVLAMITPAAS